MTQYKIQTIVVPPMYSNCYIMSDEDGNAVVVDPGGIPDEIHSIISTEQLKVEAIINTHGHIDHVGANAEIRRRTKAPIHIHEIDSAMLKSALLCGASWSGLDYEEHSHDKFLVEDTVCDTGHFKFQVHHTPGHCPGSVSLIMPEQKLVFTGDVVFMDSIGRSDLPGGDEKVLMDSLRWFLTLPDDYTVLPGHGAATTVERERRLNPFLRRLQK